MVHARVVCSCCAMQLPLVSGAVTCARCGSVNVIPVPSAPSSLAPLALAIAGLASLFVGMFALHASRHHRRHHFGHHSQQGYGHHAWHADGPGYSCGHACNAAVAPAPASTVVFARHGGTYRLGDRVAISFAKPLVGSDTSNWISVVPAKESDPSWGDWQYVPAGATQQLVELRTAGDVEIRLHDQYPQRDYHVVERLRVHVQPL